MTQEGDHWSALQSNYEEALKAFKQKLEETPTEEWELTHNVSERPGREVLEAALGNCEPSLKDRLWQEFLGVGPLEGLLEDDSITEILIRGHDEIWVEKNGRLEPYWDKFLGVWSYEKFFNSCLDESKILLSIRTPHGDGVWRGFRIHAIAPPLVEKHSLCLRRQSRKTWTLDDLKSKNWAPPHLIEFLCKEFRNGRTFIIYGDTGSGKTAAAEAFLSSLPANCRVLLLEDTREIRRPTPSSESLLARPSAEDLPGISFQELIRQALRMRPERLVMGEIRGQEAKDFLMVLSSGHTGGMATLHANGPSQALMRLEMLIQLGAPQWNLRSVRLLLNHAVSYLLGVGRTPLGQRQLLQVDRIDGIEETGLLLETLYSHENSAGSLKSLG